MASKDARGWCAEQIYPLNASLKICEAGDRTAYELKIFTRKTVYGLRTSASIASMFAGLPMHKIGKDFFTTLATSNPGRTLERHVDRQQAAVDLEAVLKQVAAFYCVV